MTNSSLMWADMVCREADEAQKRGDLTLVNGLGKSAAMLYYFTNVYTLRSVTRESFGMYYPGMVREIERLHAEYERDAKITEAADTLVKNDQRITAIETTLQQLMEAVKGIAGKITTSAQETTTPPEPDEEPDEADDIGTAMSAEPKQERKRSKG